MSFPSPKELKKLADACRKAGISKFKCGDLEFELGAEAPQSPYKRSKAAAKPQAAQGELQPHEDVATEDLDPMSMLLYSSAPGGMPIEVDQE